jgi:hypothetical protein
MLLKTPLHRIPLRESERAGVDEREKERKSVFIYSLSRSPSVDSLSRTLSQTHTTPTHTPRHSTHEHQLQRTIAWSQLSLRLPSRLSTAISLRFPVFPSITGLRRNFFLENLFPEKVIALV